MDFKVLQNALDILTHPRVRRSIAGSRTRPLMHLRGGRRFIEVFVGGEAAGISRKGETTEGIAGY